MSLDIGLMDAETNCSRDGATATLTLRSGVQLHGKLIVRTAPTETVRIETARGWSSVLRAEIAAVGVEPPSGF